MHHAADLPSNPSYGHHFEVVAVQVEWMVLVSNIALVHQHKLHRLVQVYFQHVEAAAKVSLTQRCL